MRSATASTPPSPSPPSSVSPSTAPAASSTNSPSPFPLPSPSTTSPMPLSSESTPPSGFVALIAHYLFDEFAHRLLAQMPEIEGAGFAGQPDAGGRPSNPGAGAAVEGSGASGDGDSWHLRPAHPLFLSLLQYVLCYPHLPPQTFVFRHLFPPAPSLTSLAKPGAFSCPS
ncbi:hypothetical protein ZIOFF_011594 [Zingiber officinale]|uniref:Uncharacterized protein n=1 Tax=Zingiber officinale TaxID=94328 RepID=A0A8J5LKW5_ZINOF|nr:hypothetical protein ZIOFF_011594 [Zingiber officinale]